MRNADCDNQNRNKSNRRGNIVRIRGIKVKGRVARIQYNFIMRLFSANCNGIRPRTAKKVEQLVNKF